MQFEKSEVALQGKDRKIDSLGLVIDQLRKELSDMERLKARTTESILQVEPQLDNQQIKSL